jgi:hypothetical protein
MVILLLLLPPFVQFLTCLWGKLKFWGEGGSILGRYGWLEKLIQIKAPRSPYHYLLSINNIIHRL